MKINLIFFTSLMLLSFNVSSTNISRGECGKLLVAEPLFASDDPVLIRANWKYIIRNWNIPEDSLASDFVLLFLKKKLIDQNDKRLEVLGLNVPGGGLCNAICAAAVRLAQAAVYPIFAEFSHEQAIEEFVRSVTNSTGNDARAGSTTIDAKNYFARLMALGFLPGSLQQEFVPGVFSIRDIKMKPGEVFLASLRPHRNPASPVGHAVILLALNSYSNEFLVYNPNAIGYLERVPYWQVFTPYGIGLLGYHLSESLELALVTHGLKLSRGTLKVLPAEVLERLSK